jgi:hypothetical protein
VMMGDCRTRRIAPQVRDDCREPAKIECKLLAGHISIVRTSPNMSTFQQFRDIPDPIGTFDGLFRAAFGTLLLDLADAP